MLWKCCTQYATKFGKLSSGHRTAKGQFSFQSQREAMSKNVQFQFSHSVMPNTLWPHGLQHARPPCPSPTPGLTQTHVHWVTDAIQPSHPLSSSSPPASIIPNIEVFSNESELCIRWPKYWCFSFSISPSKEHLGLISFRVDCLDLLEVQGTLRIFCNTTVQRHQFFGVQLSL